MFFANLTEKIIEYNRFFSFFTKLCYNTFPFPAISDTKKAKIEEAATDILLTREP